ncbi:MAG TPA: hypothetical protein VEJ86_13850, partial [Candidatus Binataceae bacterium]|nr:hypothetical protein [Candidatus Binataceae bacterium]
NCALPLYTWMRELPVCSMLRIIGRFVIPFTLCVAVLSAIGIDEGIRRFGSVAAGFAVVLLAIGMLDSLVVSTPYMRHSFDRVPRHFDYQPIFKQSPEGDVFNQTVISQANMGQVHCYEYTPWTTTAVAYSEQGYRGEQYMVGPGKVTLVSWTPNRLTYSIDIPAPSILVINQNYEPEWHLARGTGLIFSANGLIGVMVNKSQEELVLVYGGWHYKVGLAISILTLLVAMLSVLWPKRWLFNA